MIFAKLPRAGLGNKLIVYFLGYIYATEVGDKFCFNGWLQLTKQLLFRQKSKRTYIRLFKQNSFIAYLSFSLNSLRFKARKVSNSQYAQIFSSIKKGGGNKHLLFNSLPNHLELFEYLVPYRLLIKNHIYKDLLGSKSLRKISNSVVYDVAIHIRLGDFVSVNSFDDFLKTASARTPLFYFEKVIMALNILTGEQLKFGIFTDGKESELHSLLSKFKNVEVAVSQSEISDMLRMSQSKIIITSADSSFGLWSAFLSEAVIFNTPKNKIPIGKEKDSFYLDVQTNCNISSEAKTAISNKGISC